MNSRIIYQTDDGGVAVIIPAPEAVEKYGIQAIAEKDVPGPRTVYDVPTGKFAVDEETGEKYEIMGPRIKTYPFKIVDASVIPTDRTFRAAWKVDAKDLTDGVGGSITSFEVEQ